MNRIKTESFNLAVYQQGDVGKATKLGPVLPGLFDTKDYAHMRSHVDYLASRGFLAMSFDPPGTWESAGDIAEYTASNYLKAIHELISHFGDIPTFVMGHSRGATMSIASAATNPSVQAFVSVMPSHIRGDYLGGSDEEWRQQGYRLLKRDLPPGGGEKVVQVELPYSFFEDQITYDYSEQLTNCAKPKLFIYGTHDTGATPKRVKAIYETAGEPKSLKEVNCDHNYRLDPKIITQINEMVGDFLNSSSPLD